jgi:hypothetical protein
MYDVDFKVSREKQLSWLPYNTPVGGTQPLYTCVILLYMLDKPVESHTCNI